MILKMEKLSAIGLLSDKDDIVNSLMREQCFQIRAPGSLENYEELAELTKPDTAEIYALEQQLSRYNTALAGMSFYTAKKGLFAAKPRVKYDSLEDSEMLTRADTLCEAIETVLAELSELKSEKSKNMFLKASLEPWTASDLGLETPSTRSSVLSYLMFPAKTIREEVERALEEEAPASHLEYLHEDREQLYALAVCYSGDEDAFMEVMKRFGAVTTSFAGLSGTVAANIAQLAQQIEGFDKRVAQVTDKLMELGKDVYPLQYAVDAMSVRIQRARTGADVLRTEKTFCFSGWVPETARDAAIKILDEYGCYYELADATQDEEAPILLKNSKIASPFEAITSMYSLPSYHGHDPNWILSITYFILFGMMLSDAGIGFLLFLGCLFASKKMDLAPGAKKVVTVLKWGGVSTMIWGTIFGSFFGDLPQTIARTWFGKEITITPLIDPLNQALMVMGICLGIGVIHLWMGMAIKAYIMVKRGHPWQALFDVGFWFLFEAGLIAMLVGAMLGGTSGMIFTVGAGVAIAGAVGLILTQGRDKKNPVMKLFGGVQSLYDITGFMSDVLSYSRILALGLATGVIAQVFNLLGTIAGGGVVGTILFVIVFVVGTIMNLGINTLGSYVHTARLHYVEFFGKFYEAGGKPFAPLAPQTKYIVVTNEEEN